jgi:flagellar biosynthesis protein FlhA
VTDTILPGRTSQRITPALVIKWLARGEVALALGVVAVIVLLILPVPAFLLDALLAISLASSILILMTSLFIKKPLEFTSFPTVLLVTTLFRLALNIASTRLILAHGHEGVHGA